jgi:KaiC/GvpD/RAD55 family RecA-like ATPase
MKVEQPVAKRPRKIFERLLDSDVKADLLTLFHHNANLSDTADGLARRIGRSTGEVERELNDLVELGVLEKVEVYSFGQTRDTEIQDAITKQLALAEMVGKQGYTGTGLEVPRMFTGLEVIDRLIPDGLPLPSTILVLSDPSAGEENLLAQLVSRHIQAGKYVLYITLDNFPQSIRHNVEARAPEEDIDWSRMIFVDCYSKTVGAESEEDIVVDPEDLSAISIAVSNIMAKNPVSMIVLDSFNTLIRKRKFMAANEFLRLLVARTRQARCWAFVTMSRKAWPPAMIASAEDTAEGVIELRLEESNEEIQRSLRIFKMVGVKHSTAWVRYDISDGELVRADTQWAP